MSDPSILSNSQKFIRHHGQTRAEFQADLADARSRALPIPAINRAYRVGNFAPAPGPGWGTRGLPLIAALSLAGVSAFYSITGLTAIFIGSQAAVLALGCAFEAGKLAGVAWLGRAHGVPLWLRGAVTVLVLAFMTYSAIGAYGFLAKAHVSHQVEGETGTAQHLADIDAWIAEQERKVGEYDRQLAQIDGAINEAIKRGKTNGGMDLANSTRGQRSKLEVERQAAGRTLVELKVQRSKAEGDRRVADADLGPLRYLATLIGARDEDVLRYFILGIALLLDPAAVILLLAATRR
jgi:hypothetical protein